MKLKIGFSPCPNDTFIFHAMLHGLVDTEGLKFDVVIVDVEELNKKAAANEIDVTKLSYFAFAHVTDNYILLNSGSALGNNCGPLLISKTGNLIKDINSTIAIPGKYTTANFLLTLYNPQLTNKNEVLFSEIEDLVLQQIYDAGLIIHESRFTYAKKGLKKIVDLGEWWENKFNLPIPLGGIAIKKSIDKDIREKMDRVMYRSVEFAMNNPGKSKQYIKQYSQEMDDDVIKAHIDLYVNNYTLNLGEKGRKAVTFLLDKSIEIGMMDIDTEYIFVNSHISINY